MSDTTTISPSASAPRRRGVAARRHLTIDGKIWKPRADVSATAGISDRTGARLFKNRTRYIGGVAYAPEEDCLRDLVNPPARTMRRGRHRIPANT
jgi:hypothetical protein